MNIILILIMYMKKFLIKIFIKNIRIIYNNSNNSIKYSYLLIYNKNLKYFYKFLIYNIN